ncbi:hypothetical protein GQ54DRAFT_297054 [Martensiomyces pterosporus]|nr:hypothetical protein GQ54DRAFT_297054 [Martensiomyces pterosporus]
MAKQVETQIYQQSLILKRQHESLNSMVEEFNRQNEDTDSTQSSSQHSSQSDWEEVIEMAKMPIDYVLSRSHATGSSNGDEVFKSLYYSSPSCSTAMTPGQNMNSFRRKSPRKAFPQQMTPPIEEVIEFREKLREIEKSPLFSATPLTKRTQIAEMLADTQPTPLSMP